MLITRTPFRVSFLGGGSDIPWFYESNGGGAVISTAIDKYMFLSGHTLFDSPDILLKYSKMERVSSANNLVHPIAREIMLRHGLTGVDISVSADIPAGTGLGSSSAFTVGLLNLAHSMVGRSRSAESLAAEACEIEIEILGEPIGKQDQYASALGGLNLYTFRPDGGVDIAPLNLDASSIEWLNTSMLLVKLPGGPRSAGGVLRGQREASKASGGIAQALVDLRELTINSLPELRSDITSLGRLLKQAWGLKKASHPTSQLEDADLLITLGIANGALGAKVLGAGNGGFVLFLVEDKLKARVLESLGSVVTIEPKVDMYGSTVIDVKGN